MTDYQKFIRNNAVLSSGLLGSFNDSDKYVISQDVCEKLIKCTKLLKLYKENDANCEAYFSDFKLNFKFKFIVDEAENKKYASLYLLEQYSFLGKKIDLETFIVNFKQDNDYEFFSKLKEAFKLITRDESEGKDIKNSDFAIEKIIKEKKEKAKLLIKHLMFDNKKYVLDVIRVLKKSGKFGHDMQKHLKDKLANINLDKNSPEYWAKVKEILDELLEEHKEECPQETKKMLELINQNYVQMYLEKSKNVKLIENVVKKPEVKKSKPKDKSKKSDGGKKNNKGKKKEDNKNTKEDDSKENDNNSNNNQEVIEKNDQVVIENKELAKKNDTKGFFDNKDDLTNFVELSKNQIERAIENDTKKIMNATYVTALDHSENDVTKQYTTKKPLSGENVEVKVTIKETSYEQTL